MEGVNTIVVSAINSAGSDSKTITVNYVKHGDDTHNDNSGNSTHGDDTHNNNNSGNSPGRRGRIWHTDPESP